MKAKNVLAGFALSIALRLVLASSSLPVFIGVIAAAKLDKEINALRGLACGLLLGFLYGLFISLVYRDASLSWVIFGQIVISILGGLTGLATGIVMGLLRKKAAP